jgi:hypothetical protein
MKCAELRCGDRLQRPARGDSRSQVNFTNQPKLRGEPRGQRRLSSTRGLAALAVAAKGPILLLANSGETLKSLGSGKSESLVAEDRGPQLHQTVAYRLKK